MAKARDTIVGDAVRRLRQEVGTAIKRIQASGKLQASGVLGGKRLLFFLLEANSSEELMEFLGSELIDNAECEVYPVTSFEVLGKFFAEHAV
jgi:hypothetical protein